jgi:hypothetical protein
VFHGASEHEGIRCIHPVQVYLDLVAHPERAAEAAADLRERYVSSRQSADKPTTVSRLSEGARRACPSHVFVSRNEAWGSLG